MSTGTAIRVGADVVAVHQVAASVENLGARYLERIYTEHERISCAGSPSVQAAGLAARFAAKEATIKVLRPAGHQPDWRSMEVRRHPEGWCTIALTGHAAALADQAGIGDIAVSLTHEGDVAAAVVVALCRADAADERGTRNIGGPERGPEGRLMDETIRAILAEHGKLPVAVDTLRNEDNLFEAGMTSHASVNVMLALEDEFDVEFPEAMLRKSTFESIVAIKGALGELAS